MVYDARHRPWRDRSRMARRAAQRKGVLFTVRFRGKNGARGRISLSIAVADIPSGTHRVIVDDAMYARYTTSGHLLYVTTNKTLMVAPFDQNSMKVTGEPTALTEGMRLGFVGGSADLAVSATGTLVYATGAGEGKQELVWVTRDGKAQAVDPDWPGNFLGLPTLSPDGKSLAVARVVNEESLSIWIKRQTFRTRPARTRDTSCRFHTP